MPRLPDSVRQSINDRLAIHQRILERFKEKQWRAVHCYLCGWYSNGRTFDEAEAADAAHIAAEHEAEDREMRATEIGIRELRENLHDHDCVMALCVCRCGCSIGPFCSLVLGGLCSTCTVRQGRGDSEHGCSGPPKPSDA